MIRSATMRQRDIQSGANMSVPGIKKCMLDRIWFTHESKDKDVLATMNNIYV